MTKRFAGRSSPTLACLFSAALLPLSGAGGALAQDVLQGEGASYSETFFFGDSLTDSGFYRPLLPSSLRPVTGQFTTNAGWVWSQYFADYYGTLAAPNGNGQLGTNYAVGGANVVTNATGALGPIPSVTTQVQRYLTSTGGVADPDALYTLSGGILPTFFNSADAGASATGMRDLAQVLSDAGARYIIVIGPQDLGLTPSFVTGGNSAAGTSLAQAYSDALFAAPAPGAPRIIPIDLLTFSRELHAEATAFGFTNTTGTACMPQIDANSLTCNPTSVVNPDARNSYLYADGTHFTTRAHDLISQYVISVLEAPRLIAGLSQGMAEASATTADRVMARGGPGAPDAPGWWFDTRGTTQGGDDGGLGGDLLAGYDVDAGSARLGVFAGYGSSDSDFASGGGYSRCDLNFGVHATWTRPSSWFQIQASYTASSFDVERMVNLSGRDSIGSIPQTIDDLDQYGIGLIELSDQGRGGVTRRHTGSTDGHVLSVGASGGWSFTSGSVTHGPVAGLLAQMVKVGGYDEGNPDLATALAYADQDFTALTARVGYQAGWQTAGALSPYARLIYQHTATQGADEAFARSLTLSETDYFAVPGADRNTDFVTATLGLQGDIGGMRSDLGATATFGGSGGAQLSAFFGLSQSF